jgi:hypothetical protein
VIGLTFFPTDWMVGGSENKRAEVVEDRQMLPNNKDLLHCLMLSRITYIFCFAILCYSSFFFYPKWQQGGTEATISWDVSGYYWYLPAAFIYKDIKHISFKDSILKKYGPTFQDLQQAMPLDNGNYVMKYSSGMAVMYLPFFTAAHLVAGAMGYPRDGFSAPYQFAIQFGGLIISLLGLWYLRKLLLNYYEDKVVAVTMFLLVLGSNYLNYAAIDCGMSHTWLFTLYVLLLLNTRHFYQTYKWKYAIRIGLLIGLATLTRPTEIISCIIPLLWGLDGLGIDAIKRHMAVVKAQFLKLVAAVVLAAAVLSIQFVYWKYVSGHWLVYSYGEQGFSWLHPHAILYSFNYRTGWLTYCPMMILAIAGFIPFLRRGKHRVAIVVFFALSYYLVSAWNIWWYGGRAMVQSYAVLAIPMAALVEVALSRRVYTWIYGAVAAVFFYMNFWIFIQYHGGDLYDYDTMSKPYYWRVVGRWHVPEETKTLLDAPDLYDGVPKQAKVVFEEHFDTCTGPEYVTSTIGQGLMLQLDKQTTHSRIYKIPYANRQAKWLRASARFYWSSKEWNVWDMPTISLRLDNNDVYVQENNVRVGRRLPEGLAKEIFVDLKLPDKPYDRVTLIVWNQYSSKPLMVDNLRLIEFTE